MLLCQFYQNVRVGCADGRRVAVREIDTAVGKPNIVDDGRQLRRGNLGTNVGFHAVAKGRRLFNPSASGRTHVQIEFAAINGWEEIFADEWQQSERQHASRKKADDENLAVSNRGLEHPAVASTKALESVLEFRLHMHQRIR